MPGNKPDIAAIDGSIHVCFSMAFIELPNITKIKNEYLCLKFQCF